MYRYRYFVILRLLAFSIGSGNFPILSCSSFFVFYINKPCNIGKILLLMVKYDFLIIRIFTFLKRFYILQGFPNSLFLPSLHSGDSSFLKNFFFYRFFLVGLFILFCVFLFPGFWIKSLSLFYFIATTSSFTTAIFISV